MAAVILAAALPIALLAQNGRPSLVSHRVASSRTTRVHDRIQAIVRWLRALPLKPVVPLLFTGVIAWLWYGASRRHRGFRLRRFGSISLPLLT